MCMHDIILSAYYNYYYDISHYNINILYNIYIYIYIYIYIFLILEWNFDVNGVVHNSSQEDVYSQCASHVVKNMLSGINGCILAYGQIGTGNSEVDY